MKSLYYQFVPKKGCVGKDHAHIGRKCSWCKELKSLENSVWELENSKIREDQEIWLPIYKEALKRAREIVEECDILPKINTEPLTLCADQWSPCRREDGDCARCEHIVRIY